ncbi:MAG: ABC transporter permease [Bacillota bacterium]
MIDIIASTLSMAVRVSTPFLYAALGGLIAQRSGIYNFALEGLMLGGAFAGYYFSLISGSALVGFLGVIIAGALFGWLLGYIVIRFGVSQLVVCLGVNTFFLGLTGFFYRVMDRLGTSAALTNMIGDINIPFLGDIPIVGNMLFRQNILVYLAIALFVFYAWFMRRTEYGMALRAIGENPAVAQTAGIPVFRYRYGAMMVSGSLAMLGGAYLTLSQISRFAENMIEGRGWIAIAAIILGRWSPLGTFGASLLFGAAMALSNQMQILNVGLPYQVTMMVPYILSMIALVGAGGRAHGPAALGKPYMKN